MSIYTVKEMIQNAQWCYVSEIVAAGVAVVDRDNLGMTPCDMISCMRSTSRLLRLIETDWAEATEPVISHDLTSPNKLVRKWNTWPLEASSHTDCICLIVCMLIVRVIMSCISMIADLTW